MTIEEMVSLIRQEWSDAMSDNGSIWAKTNEKLQYARTHYPELYAKALPLAYDDRNPA
jgi:hypothetical protein